MNTNSVINLCNDVINFYQTKEVKISKNLNFFKKILNKNNLARKECLLLPFATLKKVLNTNNEKN